MAMDHHAQADGEATAISHWLDLRQFSSLLQQGNDGIWYGPHDNPVSYPAEGNQVCFEIEDSSFWFQHRSACIACLVRRFPPPNCGPIFDVGGGNGIVSINLIEAGFTAALVEPGADGARNAKRRGVPSVVCASFDAAEFFADSLPAVGFFDVLEHIEDDDAFLKQIRTALTPGGRLYLTVPAYQMLRSDDDLIAGHYRRYSLPHITRLLQQSGFRIDFGTYIFGSLLPFILLMRTIPSRLGFRTRVVDSNTVRRDHASGSSTVRWIAGALLSREVNAIDRGARQLFDGSCLVSATKWPGREA